ncbi:MAG: hypothetical protein P4N59_13235 [Negativicutes bacterium]|nr:hypothetical protein [Negativicutes bacterium]
MQTANDINQFATLGNALTEMEDYLNGIEQGCTKLPDAFHTEDKSQPIERTAQLLEGLVCCQKLFHSAAALLGINPSGGLWEQASVSSFASDLNRTCVEIYDATENEDFSLLADLVEYDLPSVIHTAHELLMAVQQCYRERVEA